MSDPDLHYRGLTEVAAAIKSRAISPVEVTEALLERIERLDPHLRSYTTVTPEAARAQAREAETEIAGGRCRGPLHGVPIAVKDLCYTKGIPTSAGMAIHQSWVPDYDATVVKRLRQAGAVLLGKLHMTEGATLEHHPEMPAPLNPWMAELWTGVSSSGSGVATAAGLCYASLGSDTGGSIRYPSACNGLTGIKPTWGRVSRYGAFDLAPSFDTIGPMARSAADAAAVLGAIAGLDPDDPTTLGHPVPNYLHGLDGVHGARRLRIGVDHAYNSAGSDASTTAFIEAATGLLADLGAEVIDIHYPDVSTVLGPAMALCMVELAAVHQDTFPAQADRYGVWLRDGIEKGRATSPLDIGMASIERAKFKGRLARVFDQVDAVLTPVFVGPTPTMDDITGLMESNMDKLMRFTSPINAAGNPTITMPCGFTADGRPVAFQLVGPHCGEATLVKAAHAYQQATDWHLRRPPLA